MKMEFVPTVNVMRFNDICKELEDPSSAVGPSMAMVTGAPGRGKTEASKQYAVDTGTVYVPPFLKRSAVMLLKDIAFELQGVRPNRTEGCLNIIRDEMSRDRRLIIIDEADNLPLPLLEMLRNINELCACPILLVGEEKLTRKIASEPRLLDRVRSSMEFSPVTQTDVAHFFKKAFGLTLDKEVCAGIHRYSKGTWRRALKFSIAVERAMKASETSGISKELADLVIKELRKDEYNKDER